LLLDAQEDPDNELSDLHIREEVDTFMFEGHDTTSASLNWTIFLLGCHPNYQSKVHEELDEIFGEDKTRPITSKDLAEMKYLEACIKEALRLYPSVPFLIRYLTSDLVLDDKVTIPAGYDVALCTMPIHKNEKHFPDPEVYLPDRFLGDNSASRHPFTYIPFSAGPRNCIGQKFALMEEKTILANIFRNFKVEAAEPLKNVIVMVEIITRPRDGLRVRMQPR
jgi:cytochrome P450 family 4